MYLFIVASSKQIVTAITSLGVPAAALLQQCERKNKELLALLLLIFCFFLPLKAKASQALIPSVDMPSSASLAKDLGYKKSVWKRAVNDFVLALSQGPRGKAVQRLCAKDEDTCALLKDFHSQEWQAKTERKKSRRKRVKRFRLTEENVAQAQRFDFRILVNSLKSEDSERLFSLADKALKEPDCPRNLSAALSIKAEEYFPNEKARVLSRELFEHARHCLDKNNFAYERLFLRQALYALRGENKQKAREYLVAAKKATNSSERYRVLYWLGYLAHESGVKAADNQDWAELMAEFPLSFYAIEAAATLKQDPIEMMTQRKVVGFTRETDDPELNRQLRWLEALFVEKKQNAAAKWASWIVRSNEDDLDVGVLHYISMVKLAAGMYRSNISMLFGYFRKNPTSLNDESLRLLYPRPYFSMIDKASKGKIDTYLVLGLVRQESAFDAQAVSRAKAKGLMQIIPQTARRLASQGHKKLLNERENTKMGVKYLMQLGNKFDGSAELVLAAYNAGPNKVEEWLRRNPDRKKNPLLWNDLIPYMETRDYVVSILRNNYIYARLYGSKDEFDGSLFSSSMVSDLLKIAVKDSKESK